MAQNEGVWKGEFALGGQHDVGAPLGTSATARGVVLVEQAVADRQGGVLVSVVDEHLAGRSAPGAAGGRVPAVVHQRLVQVGHVSQVVAVVVAVVGHAGEHATL